MTCIECREIEVLIAHSKYTFCSYDCMVKYEGEDWPDIVRCPIHEIFYKGECPKC